MLVLNLFLLHRRAHQVSLKEAGTWSAVRVAIGLGFAGLLWLGDLASRPVLSFGRHGGVHRKCPRVGCLGQLQRVPGLWGRAGT
jgi:hypothetical protein